MGRRLVVTENIIKDRLIKEKHTTLLLSILCDMDAFRHEQKEENTVGLGLVRSGGESRGVQGSRGERRGVLEQSV